MKSLTGEHALSTPLPPWETTHGDHLVKHTTDDLASVDMGLPETRDVAGFIQQYAPSGTC